MPYLDIHVRTPEWGDVVARSVSAPSSEDLGSDIRTQVYETFPDATDYTFREISKKEIKARNKRAATDRLARMVINYATMQIHLDNTTKGF